MKRGEADAEQLLEDLGFHEFPICPEQVCAAASSDSYAFQYQEHNLQATYIEGMTIGSDAGAQILVNSNIKNPYRRRFTGAHELGHVCLHIQTGIQSEFKCSSNDIYATDATSNKQLEFEANNFASALLMPSSLVDQHIRRNDLSWALIGDLKVKSEVSLIAAGRRVVDRSPDSCCLIIHQGGQMWVPLKSKHFPFYLPSQPFPRHLSWKPDEDNIDKLPISLEECDAADWSIEDKKFRGELYFSSIRNEQYDRTMTLLYYEEDDGEMEEEMTAPSF